LRPNAWILYAVVGVSKAMTHEVKQFRQQQERRSGALRWRVVGDSRLRSKAIGDRNTNNAVKEKTPD
jgi:hypothetical protein